MEKKKKKRTWKVKFFLSKAFVWVQKLAGSGASDEDIDVTGYCRHRRWQKFRAKWGTCPLRPLRLSSRQTCYQLNSRLKSLQLCFSHHQPITPSIFMRCVLTRKMTDRWNFTFFNFLPRWFLNGLIKTKDKTNSLTVSLSLRLD